ncbi:MAG: TetR/AcrR family transcriptional regulator [Litorimonas sp.]
MANKTGGQIVGASTTRRRLDPDLRRAQLLEHAISAFADAGIERAAHADVGARAHVSTPTVFKYFPTREALVDAVLSEVEQTLENLKTHLPKGMVLTGPELVRAMAGILSEVCANRPDIMKVTLTWSVAFSPVRDRYLSFQTRLKGILSSLLDLDTADESDVLIIFATAKLFTRMHFDGTTAEVRRDYINRTCEVLESAANRA